jgi:hypothetical protein
MKALEDARAVVAGAASSVSGAMRVAIISCALSVLAILLTLASILVHVKTPAIGHGDLADG